MAGSFPRKILLRPCLGAALLLAFAAFICAPSAYAQLNILEKIASGDIDAAADSLDFVGNNIVGTGHVVVKYGGVVVTSDRAIVNMTNKDIEATGNVRFMKFERKQKEVDEYELEELRKKPNVKVIEEGEVTTRTGRKKTRITTVELTDDWEGNRAEGNLGTGVFSFGEFQGRFQEYYCNAKEAERLPDATMTVHDATVSTCEYLPENHDHYCLKAGRVRLVPDKGSTGIEPGAQQKYDMWAYNCTMWIGSVPILWVPILYKPGQGHLGWSVQAGKDYEWGYYVLTRKAFRLWDYPYVSGTVMADWYSRRGFGVGTNIKARTDESRTDAFFYWIYDRRPQLYEGRFNIDKNRYELKLNNVTHITPRLDFRGQIDKLSDINFIYDFFKDRFEYDPQPSTFADLEYQFDRLTVSAYVRPRVNSFFTEVDRLPELRIDIPRQELFWNIYYQGETNFTYLMNKWRDYDEPRQAGNKVDPKDYESARVDSLHMFYYPFEIDWLNIIPRAGFRLTYYSKTPKDGLNQHEVDTLFIVDDQGGGDPPGDVVNYRGTKENKLRFIGELGFEANTKISRAWNDVKNAFWGIDGIRHVMVPYLNYNFTPPPTIKPKNLYYFDDIDRIDEQHFVRLGYKNRLETRRGEKKQELYTWASLENYFDFHFDHQAGYDALGDFGTIFEFNPFPDFKLRSELLVDAANFSVQKFKTDFTYTITKRWKTFIRYNYQANYMQRGTYSMGSSLADIDSSSAFARQVNKNQEVSFGLDFPITEKTRGEFEVAYNVRDHNIEQGRIRLIRNLHCWEVALEYAVRQRQDDMGKKYFQNNVMFMLYLTAQPSVKIQARQSFGGQGGNEGDSGGGGDEGG